MEEPNIRLWLASQAEKERREARRENFWIAFWFAFYLVLAPLAYFFWFAN